MEVNNRKNRDDLSLEGQYPTFCPTGSKTSWPNGITSLIDQDNSSEGFKTGQFGAVEEYRSLKPAGS